ncbi:MAG: terpene cyclase/mutase family protein [Opitutae bacterium]|nr:terpene cyclase/mutase family protein [Opitutae bacterium]
MNKRFTLTSIWFFFATTFSLVASAQSQKGSIIVGTPKVSNLSLKQEVLHAISKGVRWLELQQKDNGLWGEEDYPALTAMAVSTILNDPSRDTSNPSPFAEKGLNFLLTKVQSDGGIYGKGLASYNTSISMMAFMQANRSEFDPLIKKARRFLINQQSDFDIRGKGDNTFDGGIGYGSRWAHSDLSNTYIALEALHYAEKYLKRDAETKLEMDLDWEMAVQFIQRCQNLPETNSEKWVDGRPENRGGFIYFPGSSMAGEEKLPNGKVALRSYGSMSYAGLLSFIYAKMDVSDPRVAAARDWLIRNYTINENPGLGPQGIFYYYHTMAKTLTILDEDTLVLPDGRKVQWREELAKRLFDAQDAKGFWVNKNGRWWEKDPVLVTCYGLLTLERIYHSL